MVYAIRAMRQDPPGVALWTIKDDRGRRQVRTFTARKEARAKARHFNKLYAAQSTRYDVVVVAPWEIRYEESRP